MRAADDVTTPEQYLAQLPDHRKEAMRLLHQRICRELPELKPGIHYGMLGYAVTGDPERPPLVALASQKRYMSLYIGCDGRAGYLTEAAKGQLGKVSVGKSCIRFTKLENLNLEVAMDLVRRSVAG